MMRPLSGARALLFAACLSLVAGGAQAQNNPFGDLFKPPGAVQSEQAAAAAQSESVLRIDRLENQLRTMTGQIEELQYRNQQLEQQMRRFQEDVEYRLSGGKGPRPTAPAAGPIGAPGAGPGAVPPVAAPVVPGTGKRSDAFDPNEDPVAPGAPQPLGSPTSASAGLARPSVPLEIGPGGSGAPARAGAPAQTAALTPAGTAREMFDVGYGQIQRQDYAAAEQTFRQFLQAYPSDRLTPDAVYMLGESQFQRQSFKDAAELFLQVSTKYPNSTRAPEALLRLGQSLASLNEREAACATFGEVDRKYPRAASTVRQAVEREQKRAGC
ncbi:tol-pal system protein YbgF [Roseixanthobacter glucoisosaccharinicivorans]|uniref:tol-pal system protein YbgF n=1 Tax=Roseixanthobacter glucoisosaccharinicivorans TaxID=3119923 RepID=UPI00372C5560